MQNTWTGTKIRRIRTKELRVSLDWLAEKTYVSKPTLIKYEKGRSRPKQWFIEKLEQIRKSPIVTQIRKCAQKCKKRLELIAARGNRSQREIAQVLRIDFTLLSKWENGRVTPPKSRMQQLAWLYRTTKEKLFPDVFGQKETALQMAA